MSYILHPDGFVAVLCPLCGAVVLDPDGELPQALLNGEPIGPVCFGHIGEFIPGGWFEILEEVTE